MYENYALIVGVQSYRNYDPSGNANVPGARNDARAWFRACLAMGFSPERIRVLASPPLTPGELGPGGEKATLGEANREGIAAGLMWLSEKLGGDTSVSGLFTFSGHGDEGEALRPVIFPSDTTPSLEEGIDVAALREKSSAVVRDNLTTMLDCCSAQVGVSAAESMRGRMRARRAGKDAPEPSHARVVAACKRDQESVSSRFLGEEMGAFTWAVTSTIGQWKVVVEEGVARLDVSYADLLTRTRALLSALAFEQEPVLSGPEGTPALAFLHPGTSGARGETSTAPTATRKGHQLDAGQLNAGQYRHYQVLVWLPTESFVPLADIYVTGSDMGATPPRIGSTAMAADTEYWVFPSNAMTSLAEVYATSAYLQIYAQPQPSSSNVSVASGASCFTASEETSWTHLGETRAPEGSYTFSQSYGTIRGIALSHAGTTPTSVWWVQTTQENLTPNEMNVELYPNGPAPSSSCYYAASSLVSFNPNG